MAGIGTGTNPRTATNGYQGIGGPTPRVGPPTGIGGGPPVAPGGWAVKPPPTYGGPPVVAPPPTRDGLPAVMPPPTPGPGVVPAPRRRVHGGPGLGVMAAGGQGLQSAPQPGGSPVAATRLNDMALSPSGATSGEGAPTPEPYGTRWRWDQIPPDHDAAGNVLSGGLNQDWIRFRNQASSFLDGNQVTDPGALDYIMNMWSANQGPVGVTRRGSRGAGTPEQADAALADMKPKYRAKMDAFFQKYGLNPYQMR